jgi:hypothetical protein
MNRAQSLPLIGNAEAIIIKKLKYANEDEGPLTLK